MACILIIDDEEHFRKMFRQMLERSGYEVLEAANGKTGEKLYREEQADLIITDIFMPEKDGIETIIALRRDFPDVKIIGISGGGRMGTLNYLKLSKKFGAERIFSKPFDRRKMLEAISDLIRKK